jgi:hypothetical protein
LEIFMTYDLYFDQNTGTTLSRPKWFDDAGQPVTDDQLRERGIYPVQQVQAEADLLLHHVEWDAPADWPLVDGVYQRTQTVTNKPLLSVQMDALKKVDVAAEAARSAMLTPGSGQALEYQRTEAEARAWTEGANTADFPMLKAELEAMKLGNPEATIDDVVAEALSNANLWLEVGAAIKQVRRSAKVLIEHAQTPANCRAVIDWADTQFKQILTDGTFTEYTNT